MAIGGVEEKGGYDKMYFFFYNLIPPRLLTPLLSFIASDTTTLLEHMRK